jgi:indolepyruvate ferredoxin oxidoreductase
LAQELRLQRWKVYAAMAYARANHLNRVVVDSKDARFGIITTGKSFLDVCQALDALGIDPPLAQEIGLRVLKIGMSWPLDAEAVRHFAEGLEEVLVVEEKRQVIEYQLKEQLYNWREDVRPKVIGKYDDKGEWELPLHDWQLPAAGELTPAMVARVIASRIGRYFTSERIRQRMAFLDAKEAALASSRLSVQRVPHYCSGCPHNTSTKVPEGSRALAGIGCHYMATWLSPETTQTFSQMGGEGVAWVGQSPFTETRHVFANLGDGTYFHSGLLAIRQAVAAGVNITYKVLYNDAVAMTGGQKMETGQLTVPKIAGQLAAESVHPIVVVSDEPEKYGFGAGLPAGTPVHHRSELDAVQRTLREQPGVSAIIYDQTCAAEKRRRRKRGEYPDPAQRILINDRVCEGCGDCSTKSFCMSVVPLETEWGRKRSIDQSSCNKDYSCVEGFCPSFVSVEGGTLRKGRGRAGAEFPELPTPTLPGVEHPYSILVTGVGGTGVVTIGAILGMAAHREGKGVSVLDMAGLAQKGGAVWSHIRIAETPEVLYAARIAAGEANLVIGCDVVVAVAEESVAKMQAGVTRAVVNSDFSITSDFVRTFAAQARTGDLGRYRDPRFPLTEMEDQIVEGVGEGRADFCAATRLATALMGDSIATNLFMLGYAWQKGLVPLSEASIMEAIAMSRVAVDFNKESFLWGRRAAHDLKAVEAIAAPDPPEIPPSHRLSTSLGERIARRVEDLTLYQDGTYAERYKSQVERIQAAEAEVAPGETRLAEAVARQLYKLMAIKDEYEVARLYTDGEFLRRVAATFEGDYTLRFHLAPPLLARLDPVTGEPRKRSYGPRMLAAFRLLARLKGLRGTAFDPFARNPERRAEREDLASYERLLDELTEKLAPANYEAAIALASIPDEIRGYGHIRERHRSHARAHERELLDRFRQLAEPEPRKGGGVQKSPVVMTG